MIEDDDSATRGVLAQPPPPATTHAVMIEPASLKKLSTKARTLDQHGRTEALAKPRTISPPSIRGSAAGCAGCKEFADRARSDVASLRIAAVQRTMEVWVPL